MQNDERMALLLEMRKRFREARPDLNLPADADDVLSGMEGEDGQGDGISASREAARRRLDALAQSSAPETDGVQADRKPANNKPSGRAARLIKRYLQSK